MSPISERIAVIRKTRNKYCWGHREKGTFVYTWWECKLVQTLWKIIRRFLKKVTIELLYNRAIPLLGIYPMQTNTTFKDIGSLQHYLQQPRHGNNLSDSQWMNGQRRRGIYTMEYRSAMVKNEIMPFATTWIELEGIRLSEVRERTINTVWSHLYVTSKQNTITDTENWPVFARAGSRGWAKWYRASMVQISGYKLWGCTAQHED